MHRSQTEISPLFSDPHYTELLLLGGDLNTSTQWPKGRLLDGDRHIDASGTVVASGTIEDQAIFEQMLGQSYAFRPEQTI